MQWARLGVLLDQQVARYRWKYGVDVFEAYIGEILSHRGVPFEWYYSMEEVDRARPDLLIVAVMQEDQQMYERLWSYAEQGGSLISYGGLDGMASSLGFVPGPQLMTGYAKPNVDYVSCGDETPWRFLKASRWLQQEDKADHPTQSSGTISFHSEKGQGEDPLLIHAKVNGGSITRWAVDIPSTIVMFQQGRHPVVKDGIPAPDGTADVRDGVLKVDDVYDMDWELDRRKTETGAVYFAFPYADWWRELLVGQLLQTAANKGLSLPFIGYWPDGVSDVALISHDSDYNEDEHAVSTLDILKQHDVRSTWCMIEPGYSEKVYERVKEEGHELAFHYNAVAADEGFWDEAEFSRQFAWLKKAIGEEKAVSNKNHLTRMEGWGELFQWCEKNGLESDQTRGPSKKGNVGFLYGTCLPYYPISRYDEQNRMYSVLEIGFLTPDMNTGKWSDNSIILPLLQQVQAVHGVAHFLFHQIHLHRLESVRQAFAQTVQLAREYGFVFWTGREILEWEKKRRQAQGLLKQLTDENRLSEQTVARLPEKTVVWVPVPADEDNDANASVKGHYGLACSKLISP